MCASAAVRSLRAVVFAAVCVLLAAAGHGLAMGDMPPLWACGAAFAGVFVAGWLLGGRERSLPGIGAAMLATQAVLHVGFDAARAWTGGPGEPGSPGAMRPMSPVLSMPPTVVSAAHGVHMLPAHAHALPAPITAPHAVVAHIVAALVASWWLRCGEAALWSLLRRAVACVPGLLAWWRAVPAALTAPAVRSPRAFAVAPLSRSLRLRHAVSRRGPPARIPYPVRTPTPPSQYGDPTAMSTTRTAVRTAGTLRRAGLVTALAAAGVLTAAGAAFAHVTVHPDSYAKGATDGVLTFRVPNEEDSASTTKVQVFLPTDHPVLGALVTPRDGWTAKVTTSKLKTPVKTDDGTITEAVSEITWTGGKIGPGQYQDFDVAFGQLPDDVGQLTFKTLQTYSDGKVVRWIEEPQGGEEPENPAPVLKLTAGGGEETAAPSSDAKAASGDAKAASASSTAASSSDSTARGLGIAGLVVGALGLAAAGFAIVRTRSARS